MMLAMRLAMWLPEVSTLTGDVIGYYMHEPDATAFPFGLAGFVLPMLLSGMEISATRMVGYAVPSLFQQEVFEGKRRPFAPYAQIGLVRPNNRPPCPSRIEWLELTVGSFGGWRLSGS